jgi:peptidoglycan/xylan/chitin deacetylase (PgdA/CDA1 family)
VTTARLRTLVYHRIESASVRRSDLAPDLVSATPELFVRHLRHIARSYTPVGADELMAALDGKHRLPPGAVLMTFDDGYRDFEDIAWPLLKQFRIPCVLFVCTDYASRPDQLFWWDALWQILSRTGRDYLLLAPDRRLPLDSERARATAFVQLSKWLKSLVPAPRASVWQMLVEQLGVKPQLPGGRAVLDWQDLHRLADDGLTIAPHGRSHELLDRVSPATLELEVRGAREDVRRELGACAPLFAYPNGNVDARAIRALQQASYRAAFTTVGGLSSIPGSHPLALRRDQGRASLLRLALKLTRPLADLRTVTRKAAEKRVERAGGRDCRLPGRSLLDEVRPFRPNF